MAALIVSIKTLNIRSLSSYRASQWPFYFPLHFRLISDVFHPVEHRHPGRTPGSRPCFFPSSRHTKNLDSGIRRNDEPTLSHRPLLITQRTGYTRPSVTPAKAGVQCVRPSPQHARNLDSGVRRNDGKKTNLYPLHVTPAKAGVQASTREPQQPFEVRRMWAGIYQRLGFACLRRHTRQAILAE